jgi:hypothetical protein
LLALELIAERRIREAVERGELRGLPGEGAPLDLYEDPLVPEEMKMAKRILGNAGIGLAEVFGGLREELRRRRGPAG